MTEMDSPEFFETFLHVRTKDSRVIPFRMNPVQLKLNGVIAERESEGRPVRVIVLKARQEGVSTYSLGKGYQHVTTGEARFALMVCHDDDSTRGLFDRLKLMYELAPRRPMSRGNNRTELEFRNPNRRKSRVEPGLMSSFMVATAGNVNVGRSRTLQFCHLSEVALWKNADQVLLSLEQAIPHAPGTYEIIESTAMGVGGEFYDRWKRAEDPETRGDWIPVFLAWWEFPEYRMPFVGAMLPVPSSVDDVESFAREERDLVALYGVDDEQLNWRRWAIVNKCGNRVDKFRQEYPASADEAFLTTGSPVFNLQRIEQRVRQLRVLDLKAKEVGGAPRFQVGNIRRKNSSLAWRPDPAGYLRVYKWPEKHHRYAIGADTAQGLTIGKDPDYCAAQVIDRHSWEQVAVFRGRKTPSEFAEILWLLGYFYNKAKLAPESNNHGHSVLAKLEEERYPNLYIRQDMDKLGNIPVQRSGWENNAKSRPIVIDAIDDSINSSLGVINDLQTLEELKTFVHDPKTGKEKGASGCHDDLVMALGIAYAVMQYGDAVIPEYSKLDVDRLNPDQQMVHRMLERSRKEYTADRQHRYGRTA